ncbi:MAG: protease complex subunit PrcB family protein [Anaerolineae bacterium]|nr:protease complex subunit PrcB family protein [Anaerolineae bacterium]
MSLVLAVGCTTNTPASPAPGSPTSPALTVTSTRAVERIAFRTLARGFRLGGSLSQPTLLVATDPAGRDALSALVAGDHRALIEAVDLQQEALLAVFRGTMPFGGFSITIDSVSIADTEIVMEVTLRDDDPAFGKIEAATLPYHVVAIDRSALLQSHNWRYRLMSGTTRLAAGELSLR